MNPIVDISPEAAALHRESWVFDAHADTLTEMSDRGYDLDAGPPGTHIDLPRSSGGNLDAQVFTCFVNPKYLPDGAADRVRTQLDTMERQLTRFPERLALCTRPGQVRAARASGRLAAVLAIEGGHAIENNSNEWADGCGDDGPHGGLTARGREVVAAMEELEMVVDVSHAARTTFDDVLAVARRPLFASHSCARALREHPRNLDDDQLRALAAQGGLACVNFFPRFLVADGEATLDDLLDHVDHFIDVAGPGHVGLGADFDGIPAEPVGMQDVTALPRLTAGMLERGHSPETVRAVLGENLLAFFDGPGSA